nr:YkyA family protein [Oceanobacillus senegalensis]
MLQREDLKQEELTDHINKINDSYQKVLDANKEFNQYTVEYNELKKEFYQAAGLEVTFDENPPSD